jgi:hypothetical protein
MTNCIHKSLEIFGFSFINSLEHLQTFLTMKQHRCIPQIDDLADFFIILNSQCIVLFAQVCDLLKCLFDILIIRLQCQAVDKFFDEVYLLFVKLIHCVPSLIIDFLIT